MKTVLSIKNRVLRIKSQEPRLQDQETFQGLEFKIQDSGFRINVCLL